MVILCSESRCKYVSNRANYQTNWGIVQPYLTNLTMHIQAETVDTPRILKASELFFVELSCWKFHDGQRLSWATLVSPQWQIFKLRRICGCMSISGKWKEGQSHLVKFDVKSKGLEHLGVQLFNCSKWRSLTVCASLCFLTVHIL